MTLAQEAGIAVGIAHIPVGHTHRQDSIPLVPKLSSTLKRLGDDSLALVERSVLEE